MLREMHDAPAQYGFMLPPMMEDVAAHVVELHRESRGENLPPGRVPQTTWWAQEGDERLVGIIRLRHRLNDALLQRGGHIGYIVRPTDRGRGLATRMLAQAVQNARDMNLSQLLLTCDPDNLASRRVIEHNGGELDPVPVCDDQTWLRYWIRLAP